MTYMAGATAGAQRPHVTREPLAGATVTILRIDRQDRKNALSHEMRTVLSENLEGIASDERCRVTVLTATGDIFSSGFDLYEFGSLPDETIWDSADRLHRALLQHPLPIVAAVNGPAYGGGFDLMTFADVRIGAQSASFAHPERLRFPVMYSPLAEIVGAGRAKEIVLTGRVINADEALQIGLLNEVVTTGNLLQRASAAARDIAQTPRELLSAMRRKFSRQTTSSTLTTLEL